MKFYRGNDDREWEGELDSIIKLAEKSDESDSQNKISVCGNLQVLSSSAFLRPFRCVGILFILYNMSGILTLTGTYTDTFFEVYSCLFWLHCFNNLMNVFWQLASKEAKTSIPAEYQAIIHGALELAASLLGPIILTKVHKRTAFILCGALAALSMAVGSI